MIYDLIQQKAQTNMLKDFVLFKRMVIPYLIQILFWLGVIALLVAAVFNFIHGAIIMGLITLILGPIALRLVAEYVIVIFQINDTLLDIKQKMNNV